MTHGTIPQNLGIFHWSPPRISPSPTLSISCQSSLQIIAPVHRPSVNSPSNYLIPIYIFFLFSFAPQYFYLHIHLLHIYHSSVYLLNCHYFAITAYLLPYLPNLTSVAHTVYRLFYCQIKSHFICHIHMVSRCNTSVAKCLCSNI